MSHPLFRVVFDDWHRRAGVFSARPDAPVVADPPRRHRSAWRRLRRLFTSTSTEHSRQVARRDFCQLDRLNAG